MGGCCSSEVCCTNVSPKPSVLLRRPRKRPWQPSVVENGSVIGENGVQSSNCTGSLSRRDDAALKNHRPGGTSSSEGLARSSSIFVDTEEDGYEYTAMSQLLVQVTDLLATSPEKEVGLELQFSPSTLRGLATDMAHLAEEEQLQQLPTLKGILRASTPSMPFYTNAQELGQLEGELFTFLANNAEEGEFDPLVALHRCLASRRIRPPYNRFLKLHLIALLKHPAVQQSEEMNANLLAFLQRMETSPEGLMLTTEDTNFLLELLTLTNAPIFSPISTPPAIFNHRDSPIIVAAMKIAAVSGKLQRLAGDEELAEEAQKMVLEEAQALIIASENPTCPSARFYAKVIPSSDRSQLSHLLTELKTATKLSNHYRIAKDQAEEIISLSTRLGEYALVCAKVKVAKAHHIVKNRFHLLSDTCQRVCVLEKDYHPLLRDALLLVKAAGLTRRQEVEKVAAHFTGQSDVELGEKDAACLEHVLTMGIDFQLPRPLTSWQSVDESTESNSELENRETREADVETFILPVDASVVRNPFALAKTPETDHTSDTITSNFFNTHEEDIYELSCSNRPKGATSTLTSNPYNLDDFKTSNSELVSRTATLPSNDAHFYFKLISETLLLRKFISGMQRSPKQLFTFKLASFQIIQLCDCVRKLSSVEPHSEDGKLIKKLSIEANRHVKFKLKAKTVGRLKSFYQRIHEPVYRSSCTTLAEVVEAQNRVEVTSEMHLNAVDTFYLIEICSAVLFDTIDSLSLFFFDSLKHRCITSSANTISLSDTEFKKLNLLVHEASVTLQAIKRQIVPIDKMGDSVVRLLCLYKVRALVRTNGGVESRRLCKRLLWRHALTQFLNFYPDKAQKSPFAQAAFTIFIEESDHLSEETKEAVSQEVQTLIEGLEKKATFTADTVTSLLSLKAKRRKVLEALTSKFVVSSVNNRQHNCDPSLVGGWISALAANPEDSMATFLEVVKVKEVRDFLLTHLETQELNEPELVETLTFSGSDKNLVAFEPSELTWVASLTAGIGQTSAKSNLLFILILEALVKQYNHSQIFINRSIFAELQDLQVEPMVEAATSEPMDKTPIVPELVNDIGAMKEIHDHIVSRLSTNSSHQEEYELDNEDQSKQEVDIIPTTVNVDNAFELNQNIVSFLHSDNSLLYALVALRSFIAKVNTHTMKSTDFSELLFILNISRGHISNESPLYEAVLEQTEHFRAISDDGGTVGANGKTLKLIQHVLETNLATKITRLISDCLQRLVPSGYIDNVDLSQNLHFICLAIVLLPLPFETKLLAMLLCRHVTSPRMEAISSVRDILEEILPRIQPVKDSHPARNRHLRLAIPLLPLAMDSEEDCCDVDFDKLLTTVFVSFGVANEVHVEAGAKLHHLLAEIIWTIYFKREQLTSRGLFEDLHRTTSKLASEWADSDSQTAAFFYTAGYIPLDQTAQAKLPVELKGDPVQMESYFHFFQGLLVITGLMKYTDANVILTPRHLITLYHAALIAITSSHLHSCLLAKTGLIWLLNLIETLLAVEKADEMTVNKLLHETSPLRKLFLPPVVGVGRSVLENLRSRVAPVILPWGSDIGNPFMSPDPVLVREGLETSLCGYFSITASDALAALRIIDQLQYDGLSNVDLATIFRIITNLFKDEGGRFQSPDHATNGPLVDFPDDIVTTSTIGMAIGNLEILSSQGSLKSSGDVEIFLKSIFLLSTIMRPKESSSVGFLSETIVSSPNETVSSFSVRPSTGTDVYQSLEPSPALPRISNEPSPDREVTPIAPVHLNVRTLIERLDCEANYQPLPLLLNVYHYLCLLIQARGANTSSILELTKLIPEFDDILPSKGTIITESQIRSLEEAVQECYDRIAQRYRVILSDRNIELSLRVIHGYFSVLMPTITKTPIAAQGLMSLQIAEICENLSQMELWRYIEKHFGIPPTQVDMDRLLLAIQGGLKALDGFPLNVVEQICLLYAIGHSGRAMFVDLAAAIHWMEVWPVYLTNSHREYLEKKVDLWTNEIAEFNDQSRKGSLPSSSEVAKWINAKIFTGRPLNEALKLFDAHFGTDEDPELIRLIESIEPSAQTVETSVALLATHLLTTNVDEFVTLKIDEALHIIGSLQYLASNTDWLDSLQDVIIHTCRRLHLAVACKIATEDEKSPVELHRKYLHLHKIVGILDPHLTKSLQPSGEVDLEGPQEVTTSPPLARPRCVHSMEVISGSPKYLNSRYRLPRESVYDRWDSSGHSSPYQRSSLDRLQELIEIRRAVVAGSRSELQRLEHEIGCIVQSDIFLLSNRQPDKLDLSEVKRRCKKHAQHLIQRAKYEKKQAELYCNLLDQNLQLTRQET